MDIFDEIKASFKKGSNLTKLIYINLAVFVIIQFIKVVFFLLNSESDFISSVVNQLAVPADFSVLLKKPWTIFSYMFLHVGFLHILFNILWLYWFGRIFLEYLVVK